MEIYISKKCPHCKKLLVVFYNNKYLIQYFNIIDIESIQIPNYITSVPTLVHNGELYTNERLYNLIDSVNQHHLRENPQQSQNNMIQQSQNNMIKQPQNNMIQQSQSNMMDGMRQPNLNPERQMSTLNRQQPNPTQKIDKPPEDNEIVGVCWGEDCLYENINDNGGDNNLMQGYCFLDEGYSGEKPTGPNNSSATGKKGRFDENAYEQLMKSRSM